MQQTFRVKLRDEASFEVPIDVRAVYGEARPAVKMTVLGETFRTRIAVYGGKYYLALWKAVREQHGLRQGQTLEVTLQPDKAPRSMLPPPELAAALKKNPAARAGWDAMSFTHRREWAESIRDAKKPETRRRRLAQAIDAMVARAAKKSRAQIT